MDAYRAYAYCMVCDRPLRENEYRSEIGSGDTRGTSYFCRLCNAHAQKPFTVGAWVGVALMTCVIAPMSVLIFIDMAPVGDVEGTSRNWYRYFLFFGLMAIPLFTFVIGWAKKSECKPIYDRWVMQHGTDPEKWPGAPKPNRTPENRTKSEPLSKRQLLVIWVIIIVWGAVVAWMNYDAGVFD